MSTAQALISGMTSSPAAPPPRASEARYADDGSSFRDTLESASGSKDPEPRESGSKVSRQNSSESSSSRDDDDASLDADGDESAASDDATAVRRSEQGSDWALILAALREGASDGGEVIDFAAALERAGTTGSAFGALGSGAAGEMDADGAAMPGALGEGGEVVDVAALLELLRSRAGAPGADGSILGEAPTVEEIKATLLGQETHLALEPTTTETMARLMEPVADGTAETGEAVLAKPGANAEAAANAAASDALEVSDRRPAPAPESRATSGTAESRGWQDGAALDTPTGRSAGNAGQQGQSNGGQGSNGQNGSAVFASLVDGGARAAAINSAAGDDFETYVPVSDQIAAEVRAEVAADGLGERSSDGVLKVLQIELKPANLGSVTVRIALKDNTITLHLETARRETLAAIERDRDALMGALSSAGYTVDGITTAPQSEGGRSSATFAAATGVGADAGAAAGQQNAGQSLGNSSSGQRDSGQGAAQGADYRSQTGGKDDGTNGARRAADALYV